MARNISADSDGYVYRAVVTVLFENGNVGEYCFGPYTKASAAKAQISRETRYYLKWRFAVEVTGVVQSAYLKDWVTVDEC